MPWLVEDGDPLPLVGEQDVLELRVLLDVALLAALLELVERRLGDVDVAGLDQLLHLAVQQRQHERADVRAVDVGVRHQDHLVVARVLDVELVAHAGADRGDQRLDLLRWRSTLSMRDFSTLRILPRSGSTACVLRSRPCLAEPPAESPSTMKISASDGSLTEQSASLPGQARVLQRGLAPRQIARLARGRARL